MWRKNRRPALCRQQYFNRICCSGVDLNRNFDWFWSSQSNSDQSDHFHPLILISECTLSIDPWLVDLWSAKASILTVLIISVYPWSSTSDQIFHTSTFWLSLIILIHRSLSATGSSADPCHETYHGPSAFSEPEARAVRDFLEDHHVKAFFTLHSYSQLWLIPYGHKRRNYPEDYTKIQVYTVENPAKRIEKCRMRENYLKF